MIFVSIHHNTAPSIQINKKVNPDLLFFWPRYKEILANWNTKCMPLQKSSGRTQHMKNISSEPHKIQLNILHKYILWFVSIFISQKFQSETCNKWRIRRSPSYPAGNQGQNFEYWECNTVDEWMLSVIITIAFIILKLHFIIRSIHESEKK